MLIKKLLPKKIVRRLIDIFEWLKTLSLNLAVRSQGFWETYKKLEEIVPDITHQYSTFKLNSVYLKTKVRAQHSFQIDLTQKAIESIGLPGTDLATIVDIGDSAGTHLQYIRGLQKNVRVLSVNLDAKAVEKIKGKGMEALCARAEDIEAYSINVDIFLSFEMLEHLHDPVGFLRKLSGTNCKAFVLTVPYMKKSRVGLHHIRQGKNNEVTAENTHIFELSPEDWCLIFMHSGWAVAYDKIYLQYPRRSLFSVFKWIWRKTDFEGFYGAILIKDSSWASIYKDW